ELWLASSIDSINALVKKPSVPTNNARNPVTEFCPKEINKISDHATTGIFRENDAINRAITLKKLFTFVVCDPSSARKIDTTAANVVAAMDIKIVSINLFKTSGILASVSAVISRLENIHTIASGIVAILSSSRNSVIAADK